MAVDVEKRKGGGKLSRSETVTVRLDPKLRYLAELAARRQRRTVSSYIEWAIEDSLSRTVLDEDLNGNVTTLADEASKLWDVDDADRFAKLALRYPDLLTHEEQVRWKLIRECGYLWRGRYDAHGTGPWVWNLQEASLCFDRLRDKWDLICKVANGEAPASELPTWSKFDPKKQTEPDMDDDIPF